LLSTSPTGKDLDVRNQSSFLFSIINRVEQKKQENQLNRENRKKNNRKNRTEKKLIKPIKFLKKLAGSVRFWFYKQKNRKNQTEPNRQKTGKKPSQTGLNRFFP
jgi:hypothetical protein